MGRCCNCISKCNELFDMHDMLNILDNHDHILLSQNLLKEKLKARGKTNLRDEEMTKGYPKSHSSRKDLLKGIASLSTKIC